MDTIRPNEINMATTPTMSNKALPAASSSQDRPNGLSSKPSSSAPRMDLEPLYTSLKSSISDSDWQTYKTSIALFLNGNLNQEELSSRIDPILSTPALQHASNAFILGIIGNSMRDPPEGGTASWADDKALVGKGGEKGSKRGEDVVEKRLKFEVMQLARGERKRLKGLGLSGDGRWDPWSQMMSDVANSKKIHAPDPASVSAGGFQKTSTYTYPRVTNTPAQLPSIGCYGICMGLWVC